MLVYSTNDPQEFMEAIFGPRQHDRHMKDWRWNAVLRDADDRTASVNAALAEMIAQHRARRHA